jgi:hypothetical protein
MRDVLNGSTFHPSICSWHPLAKSSANISLICLIGLGMRPGVRQVWMQYVPQQALQNSFLMHGILALSALHLAYLSNYQETKYLQLCDKHQSIALKRFREILSGTQIDGQMISWIMRLPDGVSVYETPSMRMR